MSVIKKRIPSTVIVSILVLIHLYVVIVGFLPLDLDTLLSGTGQIPENTDGMVLMLGVIVVGVALLAFVGWAVFIAATHALCLIVTIRNRKSPLKSIRIINLVLDVANAFLIVATIVKIIIWMH